MEDAPTHRRTAAQLAIVDAVLRLDVPALGVRASVRLYDFLRAAARLIREVVGAPDYERYLEHHARCHPGRAPLDPRAYYLEFVGWRFGAGPNRCC